MCSSMTLLICGDTQTPASGLVGAIEKLKQRNNETGRTGFETQFHVCCSGITHVCLHVLSLILGDFKPFMVTKVTIKLTS